MGSTYWSFIGLRSTFGLSIIDPRDIAVFVVITLGNSVLSLFLTTKNIELA
ncbi:hypothetical protein PILCRDRAFT_16679 [Piloderma croceum F 1598]|uniref:Uncharacterized protein n=1 Tax=Piloderma croceum (strain F 1598) TaxID=765440 RepID=A0A0C3ADG5_PILCF|nr:hypothetical protein PILCRDRAFT_16679 [Piloderma croceum F 1598]